MQVKILDRVFAYENEPAALEMIFAKINEFLEDTGLIFSHLKVDDTEVYTDYYNYLKKRIDRVELVEVEVRTVTEILQDALLTAEEYLERALPETESLAGEFYQGPSEETWTKFQQLLEGVEWLNQLLETIDQNKLKPENWKKYVPVALRFKEELHNLQEALEGRDYVLMGDILLYEITPCLKDFKSIIQKNKAYEGKKDDLH